jgi:NAD-dependent SIR2 family protein deacetylase
VSSLFLLQQFFAQIYGEAKNSKASPGHVAIAQLHELGKLQRHYTLNIDGLAEVTCKQQRQQQERQR